MKCLSIGGACIWLLLIIDRKKKIFMWAYGTRQKSLMVPSYNYVYITINHDMDLGWRWLIKSYSNFNTMSIYSALP